MHPELVSGLFLMVPAGLPVRKPFIAKFVFIPFLAEILMSMMFKKRLVESTVRDFGDTKKYAKEIEFMQETKRYLVDNNPSFLPSCLSILRHFPLEGIEDSYKKLGKIAKQVGLEIKVALAKEDLVVPLKNKYLLESFLPTATIDVYEGVGHLMFLQIREKIVESIYQFSQKCSKQKIK